MLLCNILPRKGDYNMIKLHDTGVFWQKGAPVPASLASPADREKTIAYQIFRRHNLREEAGQLHLKFDSLISHDTRSKTAGLMIRTVLYITRANITSSISSMTQNSGVRCTGHMQQAQT